VQCATITFSDFFRTVLTAAFSTPLFSPFASWFSTLFSFVLAEDDILVFSAIFGEGNFGLSGT
jgi:hypothetical protein